MRETVVEAVNLRGVDLHDAVAWWNTAGLKSGGWNSIVNGDTTTTVKITIVGRHMNSLDLLNEICRQANLVWFLTDRLVYMCPREQKDGEQSAAPLPRAPQPGHSEGAR